MPRRIAPTEGQPDGWKDLYFLTHSVDKKARAKKHNCVVSKTYHSTSGPRRLSRRTAVSDDLIWRVVPFFPGCSSHALAGRRVRCHKTCMLHASVLMPPLLCPLSTTKPFVVLASLFAKRLMTLKKGENTGLDWVVYVFSRYQNICRSRRLLQ